MLKTIIRYYHTLRHLRRIQWYYRIYYTLRKVIFGFKKIKKFSVPTSSFKEINLQYSISGEPSFIKKNTFQFLNLEYFFQEKIDWNYSTNGKLWTYNLTYFEFLSQTNMSREDGLFLIHDFIENIDFIKDGLEPFPISLRTIFWIKFLIKHQINSKKINNSLYQQVQLLLTQLEYHLLGNHLLENGFALLFGAYFFQEEKFYLTAKSILIPELEEQILPDGAHFELSPMYHQLMLYRILDCINLINSNQTIFEDDTLLLTKLKTKASLMLSWLQQISFSNGTIPYINDSTKGIAPDTEKLYAYAKQLKIEPLINPLKESGYRMIRNDCYELLVDVGDIGPTYIPGHAHSDTFNFVVYHQRKPLIVDTGISTYEKNELRQRERSTSAHNTVEIEGMNQTDVWGGFRVGIRAEIISLEETNNSISATHNGYKNQKALHTRIFKYTHTQLNIEDEINSLNKAVAFLHFHPNIQVILNKNEITGAFWKIIFQNADRVELTNYQYAEGYNKRTKAIKAIIHFRQKLHTQLSLT